MIRCNHHNLLDYNHHDHHDYHHLKLDHLKLDPHLRSSLEDVTQELRRLRPRTLRNFCSLSFHVSIYSHVCLFLFYFRLFVVLVVHTAGIWLPSLAI